MTVTRRGALRLARAALRYELGMWRSLAVWLLRLRRVSGPGVQGHGYAGILTPLFIVFIVVSAIELPIVHMVLPWHTARLVADILGGYGLFWMIGLLAAMRVRPHVVSDTALRVRYGFGVDVTIPWTAVASVRSRGRSVQSRRTVHCEQTAVGLVASVAVMKQTNVDLVLREPTVIDLPQCGGEPVVELRIFVDDPGPLVGRVRTHLAGLDRTA